MFMYTCPQRCQRKGSNFAIYVRSPRTYNVVLSEVCLPAFPWNGTQSVQGWCPLTVISRRSHALFPRLLSTCKQHCGISQISHVT